MATRTGTWDGGYVYEDAKGRPVYVIRKTIEGKTYEVSTKRHTSRAAHEELKRFELDPRGYRAGGSGSPVIFDEKLCAEFVTWSRDVKRNAPEWVRQQKARLEWWLEHLGGRDLRRVKAEDLLAALAVAPEQKIRIIVIKRFFSWLVEQQKIEPAQDPTFRVIKVPQGRPEQWTRPKAIEQSDFERVRDQLLQLKPAERGQHWVDALDVLAGTGWHTTELVRFARDGAVELHPTTGGAVLVNPQTKGGEPLRTAVSAEVAAAARRLLERGTLDRWRFADALRAASKKLKLKRAITPGRFRHAVATWAINAGAEPGAVAAFLGHKSPRTTRRFYATHAVPAKVPTLR